jgi:hypothetical protein
VSTASPNPGPERPKSENLSDAQREYLASVARLQAAAQARINAGRRNNEIGAAP